MIFRRYCVTQMNTPLKYFFSRKAAFWYHRHHTPSWLFKWCSGHKYWRYSWDWKSHNWLPVLHPHQTTHHTLYHTLTLRGNMKHNLVPYWEKLTPDDKNRLLTAVKMTDVHRNISMGALPFVNYEAATACLLGRWGYAKAKKLLKKLDMTLVATKGPGADPYWEAKTPYGGLIKVPLSLTNFFETHPHLTPEVTLQYCDE